MAMEGKTLRVRCLERAAGHPGTMSTWAISWGERTPHRSVAGEGALPEHQIGRAPQRHPIAQAADTEASE